MLAKLSTTRKSQNIKRTFMKFWACWSRNKLNTQLRNAQIMGNKLSTISRSHTAYMTKRTSSNRSRITSNASFYRDSSPENKWNADGSAAKNNVNSFGSPKKVKAQSKVSDSSFLSLKLSKLKNVSCHRSKNSSQ